MRALRFLLVCLFLSSFAHAEEAKPVISCGLHYWASKNSDGKILKSNLFPSFEVVGSKEWSNEGFKVKISSSEVCTAEGTGCRLDRFGVEISKNGSTSVSAAYVTSLTYGVPLVAGLIVDGEIYKVECAVKAPNTSEQ